MKKFLFVILCFSIFILLSCNDKTEVKIVFDTMGGSSITTITVKDDFDVNNLPVPTKDGYTFNGWYLDENYELIINEVNVPEVLIFTLYARWEINSYTIYYHTNGGTQISETTHLFESDITAPDDPIRDGFSFDGWFEDEELTNEFTFTTMPSKDLNLYAKWVPHTYTITFDSKGGGSVSPIEAKYNSSIEAPPSPVYPGFVFLGWFLDENYTQEFEFITMPLNGAHLYAK